MATSTSTSTSTSTRTRPDPATSLPTTREGRGAHILEVARELFAENGPEAVSMADVALAAGVSRATVFNHFGSKRALLEGITEGVLSDYNTLLENAIADRDTPVPVLVRALFEVMGTGVEQQRRFHRSVFREIARLTLGLDEGGPGQVARQAALESLVLLIERGQRAGELRAELRAQDLATAFDSLVFGTITHWLYDDASESLRLRMQRAAEIFLSPVANDPGAAYTGPAPVLTQPIPPRGGRGA